MQMAAMECGDLEGCLLTSIDLLFCGSAFQQRTGRPRKYEEFTNNWNYLSAESALSLEKLRAI